MNSNPVLSERDRMRAQVADALESLADYLRSGKLYLSPDMCISVEYNERSANVTITFDMLDGQELDAIKYAMDSAGFKRFFVRGERIWFSI